MDKIAPDVNLKDKTVIVTGSSAGIGIYTAKEFARRGARVVMACRNLEKAEPVRSRIIEETKNDDVKLMHLDLSSFHSIRDFAARFNEDESRLDILVNNAGLFTSNRRTTEEGHELMFGTNHLGHFLLTHLLMDKLKASAPSRIVNVSSVAHKDGQLNFNDLHNEKSFDNRKAYSQSKAANILFTVQLAKELQGTGITAYSLHPGAMAESGFSREIACNSCCLFPCIYGLASRLAYGESLKTNEEGAFTTVYCALEPKLSEKSGLYYRDMKEVTASPCATNAADAQKLWDVSKEICNL